MIRKVKFKNFYSFYKEQEISFLTKKKKTYDYYQSKSGDQITKVAGFAGGNATGKTNVMRFFSFLGYFVCRQIQNNSENDNSQLIPNIPFKTFFNNNEPSNFYIEFEKKDSIYFYEFCIQGNIILNETLNVKKIKKGSRIIEIFNRSKKEINSLNKDYFENLSKDAFPKIREDVSFITFIKKSAYSVDVINDIHDYFLGFYSNINEMGQINTLQYQIDSLKIYLKNSALKKEMENIIRNFDIGLDGFKIKEEKKDEKSSIVSVKGIHSTKMKNNELEFSYQSRGTQYLFFTLAYILNALRKNNIVIIDEFEYGFHPEALNKIISYFIDENSEKHAQIIFTSHSFDFMNKFDMHQIYLVGKKTNSESSITRLNKVKGIRPDENFLAKYMSGAYGSFPKIRI